MMKGIFRVLIGLLFVLITGVIQSQTWVEVTDDLGLAGTPSFRISIADINGDDYPDLIVHDTVDHATWDVLNKMYVFLNVEGDTPGTRKFIDFTEESGIRANRRGTADGRHSDLALIGDVNNDGYPDYYAGVYYHRHTYIPEDIDWVDTSDLFLNDGTGRFTLTPDTVFFDGGLTNVSCAVFADFDRDGSLDLLVGNWFTEYYGGTGDIFAPELLYRGNGDGTFLDVSESSGIQNPEVLQPTYGAAVTDVDGDGFPDIFLGNYCRDKSKHLRNNGDWTFTEIHETSNYGQYVGPGNCASHTCSWGSMPRDFNNDGHIDMFTILTHGCIKVLSAPLINDGTGIFEWDFECIKSRLDDDPAPRHHGDHYATWVDWNNDGLVDLILSENGYDNNRFYIFRHEPDHTLQLVTPSTAMAVLNTDDMPVHNASVFDYDLDGDDDIIVGAGGDWPLRVFRNDIGNARNHLAATLVGAGKQGFSNTSAIGAKIQVTVADKTVTRVVRAGDGHFSPQVPLRLNIGLDTAAQAELVSITWPNLTQDVYRLKNIPANTHLRIYENPDPIRNAHGTRLFIPETHVTPGDRFSVWAYLHNNSVQTMKNVPVMAILEVAGMFWFWDTWTDDVNYSLMDVDPGVTVVNILPEFSWPDTGTGSFDGIRLYAAMLNSAMDDIVGGMNGLGIAEFGYGPKP